MPVIRDEQQPIQFGQIKSQARYIADTKDFPASLPEGGGEDESRTDPGRPGEANFRESASKYEARNQTTGVTRPNQR